MNCVAEQRIKMWNARAFVFRRGKRGICPVPFTHSLLLLYSLSLSFFHFVFIFFPFHFQITRFIRTAHFYRRIFCNNNKTEDVKKSKKSLLCVFFSFKFLYIHISHFFISLFLCSIQSSACSIFLSISCVLMYVLFLFCFVLSCFVLCSSFVFHCNSLSLSLSISMYHEISETYHILSKKKNRRKMKKEELTFLSHANFRVSIENSFEFCYHVKYLNILRELWKFWIKSCVLRMKIKGADAMPASTFLYRSVCTFLCSVLRSIPFRFIPFRSVLCL